MTVTPVGTWGDVDFAGQSPTVIKTNIENDLKVSKRLGDPFAPHGASPADLTLVVDAGFLWDQSALTLTEVAEQTTPAFTVPAVNPRTDRVVIRRSDGLAQIVAGVEAATPVPPAFPNGTVPCCLVKFLTSTPSITNDIIEDERVGSGVVDQFSIDSLTEAAELASADRLVIHDDSAGGLRKLAPATLREFIGTGFKNILVNGSMDVWQRRFEIIGATIGGHNADKWKTSDADAVTDVRRSTDIPTLAESGVFHQYSLEVEVTTADATISATDNGAIWQTIEGFAIRPLVGNDFTVSFWFKSHVTGTYSFALQNDAGGTRKYWVTEFTVDAANTWERKVITVPGGLPTDGTWNYDFGRGLQFYIVLAAGTLFHVSTLDAWTTGTGADFASANQVNALGSTGFIRLTLAQLELGTQATRPEVRPFAHELALCQRYFQTSYPYGTATGTVSNAGVHAFICNGSSHIEPLHFAAAMGSGSSATAYSPATGAINNWRDQTAGVDRAITAIAGLGGGHIGRAMQVTGSVNGNTVYGHWTASSNP